MLHFIKSEPAILLGLVGAIIDIVVAFGLRLTVEQTTAIMAVTAILVTVATRQLVKPTYKIRLEAKALEPQPLPRIPGASEPTASSSPPPAA